MAVFSALRRTPGALARNPVVFVPVLVLMAFQVPQYVLQSVNPLLSTLYSLAMMAVYVLVVPFFQGGILGMADEALDGRTSLGAFVAAGTANYVSMLGAYLAILAANVVLGIVAALLFVAGGLAAYTSGDAGTGVAAIGAVVVAGAVLALVYLLLVIFVQFYGQAIVLDDEGAVGGLKRSLSVVRHNLLATVGYTLLLAVVGMVAGLVFGLASIAMSPTSAAALGVPALSLPAVVLVAVVVTLLGSLMGGVFGTYSVAFYRALTRDRPAGEPTTQ